MKTYHIFAVNPGSTSTKIAYFMDEEMIFHKNTGHAAAELGKYLSINDQMPYRMECVERAVEDAGLSLEAVDLFVGRGGGIEPTESGVYAVNELMLRHCRIGLHAQHPCNLGCQIADFFAKRFGTQCCIVNPPMVDEFQDLARITGFKGVYRHSVVHALNQKEIGIRYAASVGKRYEDLNLVIAHIGGGISVTAHCKGRMVDSNDIINGDGPLAPTRSGSLAAHEVSKLCFGGRYTEKQLHERISRRGGFVDHLGISDARQVSDRMQAGDPHAKLVYDAMIYQIAKSIGAYATVLKGQVDAVILTGGIAVDPYVTKGIRDMAGYIAQIVVMAGEFEMEALGAGGLRLLRGEETVKVYTGAPVWSGFDFIE